MKKYFIVALTSILVCVFNISVHAQNYVFELPCDTLTSQTEMNICTYQKFKIIDSLVNHKYNCVKQRLENELKQSMLEKDTKMTDYNKNLLAALEASQTSYLALSKANRLFYNNIYEGGSIRSMMVNLSAIEDGTERLKKLDGFIDSMYGDDCGICK